MPRYFMEGTSLASLEKTMMLTPNFRPRGGGVLVRQYQYSAADCDCRYCLKAGKDKKSCGEPDGCICFEERLEAGCFTHGELARYLAGEIAMNRLTDRTRRLLPPQTATPFRDQTHRQRMTPISLEYFCCVRIDGEWESYNDILDEVNLDVPDIETEMLRVLDKYAGEEGLSYTGQNKSYYEKYHQGMEMR